MADKKDSSQSDEDAPQEQPDKQEPNKGDWVSPPPRDKQPSE